MSERRMYASTDGKRFFHVPSDVGIADGDLEVKDLLGRVRRWSAEGLAPFEVERASATDLTRQELVAWLHKAEVGLASLRKTMDEKQPGSGAKLAALQQIVGTIGGRLRARDAAKAPIDPIDLRARLEGFLRAAADDPTQVEKLRRAADDLEAAARRLRESS